MKNVIEEIVFTNPNSSSWSKPTVHHQVIEIILNNDTNYSNEQVLELSRLLCLRMGLSIVNTLSHNFSPFGNSTIFVLEESHFAVHYWPENNYLHIDLVTCQKDNLDLEKFRNEIQLIFKTSASQIFNLVY